MIVPSRATASVTVRRYPPASGVSGGTGDSAEGGDADAAAPRVAERSPGSDTERGPAGADGQAPGVPRSRDVVTVEEPLEIRLLRRTREGEASVPVAVTMRTPGHDFELAAGFLRTEGILGARDELAEITYCADAADGEQRYNVVSAVLRQGVPLDPAAFTRNFYTSSSCGVCGKASIESVEVRGCRSLPPGRRVAPDVVAALPPRLREVQTVFDETGGLHGAGLFDADGALLLVREDVGRHNAVDKVVGRSFLDGGLPLSDRVLVVSGRVSFEIVQKAVVAGIPVVVAVGAPSSLAVDLARRFGVALVGFARDGGFNLYTGEERIG